MGFTSPTPSLTKGARSKWVSVCPNALCFDVRTAAGFHSQLMGVLAGFSFLIIATLLVASPVRARDRGIEAGIISLVATLVILLASAFFYAGAAAEQVLAPRAAIIVVIAAVDAVLGALKDVRVTA